MLLHGFQGLLVVNLHDLAPVLQVSGHTWVHCLAVKNEKKMKNENLSII